MLHDPEAEQRWMRCRAFFITLEPCSVEAGRARATALPAPKQSQFEPQTLSPEPCALNPKP